MNGKELARDLALLKETLLASHPSILRETNDFNPHFDFLTRAQFELSFQNAMRDAANRQEWTQLEAIKLLLPVLSGLNDEHVELPFPQMEEFRIDNRLPVQFELAGNALRISKSDLPSIVPGTPVNAINGIPAGTLIHEMESWFSGTSREMRLALLSRSFEEALLLYFERPAEVLLDCGESVCLRFSGTKPTQPLEYRIEQDTAYLVIRSFTGEKRAFRSVVDRMFSEIARQKSTKLIIDLRDNKGGVTAYGDRILTRITNAPYTQILDSSIRISQFARDGFATYLPKWLVRSGLHKWIPVFGKLFRAPDGDTVTIKFREKRPKADYSNLDVTVLVNKASMSTASLFAAAVQQYGIGRVSGETGGFPSHFGNQLSLELPESQIRVWIPVSKNTGHGQTCVAG